MIASALMGKAKDVGQDIWSQGKGRLDVYRAAQAKVLALPQSLSLGLDDMNQSTWLRQDTISIMNLWDTTVSFTIAGPSSGSLPPGIALSVSPSNLTLPPHASGMVTVLTQVDNTVAQIPTATPPAVTGSVKCFSAADTLTIPFGLLLGSYIDLDITAVPGPDFGADVYFARRDGYSFFISSVFDMHYNSSLGLYTVRQLLPPGTYEVVAQLGGWWTPGVAWVVRDSVDVHPSARVSMDRSEAIYTIGAIPKNENGMAIDSATAIYWGTRIHSAHSNCSFGFGHEKANGGLCPSFTSGTDCFCLLLLFQQ
jgi:hypothetical protein